jgi:conjugative transfer pilus assembly protein TraH
MLAVYPATSLASGEVEELTNQLKSYFTTLGDSQHINNAAIYHSQAAGFYTGGSILARNPVHNYAISKVQFPSVKAGCGGIDIFSGGFSFISGKELERALKNVATNAKGYAFMLAIDSVSPMIANEMHAMQSWVNEHANLNIQSCEMAKALVGAVFPKTQAAQERVCQDMSVQHNKLADYTAARMECSNPNTYNRALNEAAKSPEYKDLVVENTNLAWKLLTKGNGITQDHRLAEWLMNLSGSLILKTSTENKIPQPIILPSVLTEHPGWINSILHGGSIKIYRCDESKHCLNPTEKKITIAKDVALTTVISKHLISIAEHIKNDAELSAEELNLINTTSFPLYEILVTDLAYSYNKAVATLDVSRYAEKVAVEVLANYLYSMLQMVHSKVLYTAYPKDLTEQFVAGINHAIQVLTDFKQNQHFLVSNDQQLLQRQQFLQKTLSARLSGFSV